MADDLNYH